MVRLRLDHATLLVPLQWHRDHGIDTLFFGQGAAAQCGSQTPSSTIAGQLAPKYGFYCLINADVPLQNIQNISNVLGIFLADESDDHVRIVYYYLLRLYSY